MIALHYPDLYLGGLVLHFYLSSIVYVAGNSFRTAIQKGSKYVLLLFFLAVCQREREKERKTGP